MRTSFPDVEPLVHNFMDLTEGERRGRRGGEGYINRGFYVAVLANHNSTYIKGNCCMQRSSMHARMSCVHLNSPSLS